MKWLKFTFVFVFFINQFVFAQGDIFESNVNSKISGFGNQGANISDVGYSYEDGTNWLSDPNGWVRAKIAEYYNNCSDYGLRIYLAKPTGGSVYFKCDARIKIFAGSSFPLVKQFTNYDLRCENKALFYIDIPYTENWIPTDASIVKVVITYDNSIGSTPTDCSNVDCVAPFYAMPNSSNYSGAFFINELSFNRKIYRISGTVKDSNNNPISGIAIGNTTTNSLGEYSVDVVAGWDITLDPTNSCHTFNSQTYTCVRSDKTKNFISNNNLNISLSSSSTSKNCFASNANFTITTNTDYTISSNQSWATPNITNGNGDNSVSVNINQNNTGSIRTAIITVQNAACNITKTYTITQEGTTIITVTTLPNAVITATGGYSTTADFTGKAILYVPCGYSGTVEASKYCYILNSTFVSNPPTTINLSLTTSTVTISGTVTPADASISVVGYTVTQNTSTGAYSVNVPCDWSGSIAYYKDCFVTQTINHTNVGANLPNKNITLSDDLPSFNLVSPTAFATVSSCTTTLSWANAGAGVTYQVIAFGTTTNTQYIAAADVETMSTSITINHSSEPVKWKVRAKYPNCNWSAWQERTFYPPSLNITYPTAGLNLEKGSNQTLTWTSNGLLSTSNVKLELTDLTGVPLITIANSTQNDGTYSWYTSFAVPNGDYRLKISSVETGLNNCAFDLSEHFVIVSPNCPPVTNPPTGEALTALLYLMENGIINCDQDGTVNQDPIRRYDAAKIFFIGVFGDPYAVTLADNWLTPFADINPVANEPEIQALHRKFARVMTLFEGRNIRTAFDHDRWISFRAEDFIRKKDFIKALLEAFDIEIPTTATGAPYFTEVPSTDAQFRYVQKAKEIGVLNGSETGFNTNISREEAFVFLYRLHTQQALRPAASVLQDKKSFFEFNNYTAENMGEITDASQATMGFAQTIFSIANRGFAATFSFAYSAQRIELPIEFYPHEYMGRGFSYTGNSYVLDLNNLPTNSQRIPTRNRVIVVLESGAIIWFKRVADTLQLESEGVYDVKLDPINDSTYTFRTKDYITYTFRRKGDSKQPFVLIKAKDRYNNFYEIDYETAQAPATLPYAGYSAYRPTIVRYNNGSTPRFFYYNYIPNKNLIASVHEAGGLTRKAEFGYRTDNDALISYKDPIGHQYLFYYLDQPRAGFTVASTVKHKEYLLSQVRLPNGNVMNNEYEQKRMRSQKTYDENGTPVAGQATTFYDPKPSEYKTTITIDNPEGGVMASPTAPPQANDRKYTVEYFPSKNRLRKKVTGPNTDTEYFYDHIEHPTLPSKIINWNIQTEFWYDARGNLLKKKVAYLQNPNVEFYIEEWTYNSFNDVLTYKDPDGKTTTNVYTSDGALVRVIPDGGTQYSTLIGRNSWGGVDYIQNQFGIRTNFVTDPRSGNVTRVYSPLDTLYNVYDNAERLRTSFVKDGETQIIKGKKYVYDLLDRLEIESIIGSQLGNSDSIKLEYERDANGNLLKIINDLGQETVFEYNEHTDYLMSESYAGATRSRSYYGDGRIESITKTDGTVLHFEFDDTGRITFVRQGIGGTILFTYRYKLYNPNLLDRVIAQDGDYTLYHYNGLNRIKEVVTHDASINQNSSIKYQYLASGKLDKMTYPNGLDVTYGYGVNSWLSSVTAWNGASVNYTYARDGKPTEMRYSNGVKTEYIYDDLRRPLIILTRTAANQTISGYRFKYDDFGNIVQERAIEQYNYANLAEKAGQTEYGYADFNILTSITSPQFGNEQVTQDDNGRRTQKGLHTYSWNTLDQMTATTNGNTGFAANLGYDALGNLSSIEKNGQKRFYTWDVLGGNPVMETDDAGEVINYYIYGAGMAFKINADLEVGFYHHDLRGSTIALTNHAGEVSHRYGYGSDMFGELTDVFEPTDDAQFFRYNGAYGIMHLAEGWNHNTKTGQLLSMRARWMDTESGRFLSEDPIWHSNLFPYADNNPVSNVDPSGNDAANIYTHSYWRVGTVNAVLANQPRFPCGMYMCAISGYPLDMNSMDMAHMYDTRAHQATLAKAQNMSKADWNNLQNNPSNLAYANSSSNRGSAGRARDAVMSNPNSRNIINSTQSNISSVFVTSKIQTTSSLANITSSTSTSLFQTLNSPKTFISSNRGLIASMATADGALLILDALAFGAIAGDLIGIYFDEEITTAGGWVFYQTYYRWK